MPVRSKILLVPGRGAAKTLYNYDFGDSREHVTDGAECLAPEPGRAYPDPEAFCVDELKPTPGAAAATSKEDCPRQELKPFLHETDPRAFQRRLAEN
jgi:hypothetical protein